jgi:hypothetical protein
MFKYILLAFISRLKNHNLCSKYSSHGKLEVMRLDAKKPRPMWLAPAWPAECKVAIKAWRCRFTFNGLEKSQPDLK